VILKFDKYIFLEYQTDADIIEKEKKEIVWPLLFSRIKGYDG